MSTPLWIASGAAAFLLLAAVLVAVRRPWAAPAGDNDRAAAPATAGSAVPAAYRSVDREGTRRARPDA
ncbi:hypothetical protein [Actinacidiphila alni]|uniref:hypothetical protein n=1 Tax=Actinacidiphila alni TaxID=380248 RepID=UPI0034545678